MQKKSNWLIWVAVGVAAFVFRKKLVDIFNNTIKPMFSKKADDGSIVDKIASK